MYEIGEISRQFEPAIGRQCHLGGGEDRRSAGQRLNEIEAAPGDHADFDVGERTHHERVLAAGGQIHRRRNTIPDIHLPDRERWKLRPHETGRRMEAQTNFGKPLWRDGRQNCGIDRRGFGRVVGLRPGALDARDIRQVRQTGSRLEFPDEVRKAGAVVEKNRRSRRFDHDISARHGLEEFRPDDAVHRWKGIL